MLSATSSIPPDPASHVTPSFPGQPHVDSAGLTALGRISRGKPEEIEEWDSRYYSVDNRRHLYRKRLITMVMETGSGDDATSAGRRIVECKLIHRA